MKDKQRRIFCVFLAAGVILIFLGGFTYYDTKKFMKTAISITAKIEDIKISHTHRKGKNRTNHTVYVSYMVDGKKYTTKLNEYNAFMRVGQRITVYYQKGDPYDVRTKGYTVSIIAGIMGVIFLGVGIVSNIRCKQGATSIRD